MHATPNRRIERCRYSCFVVLNVGTEWIWVVSFTFRPVSPTIEKRVAVNHRIGDWVGSADILPTAENLKDPYPCRASSQESSHYTDWATPASLTPSYVYGQQLGTCNWTTEWRSWTEFFRSYCEGRARNGWFPGARKFGRGGQYLLSERTSGKNS